MVIRAEFNLGMLNLASAYSALGRAADVSQAVLVGDVLALATRQLGTGAPVQVLAAAAVEELCQGQSADLAFEARTDVGLPECLAMAEAKTGALMRAACQLGTLAVGADHATAEDYRRFGRHLGMAFQLIDDLLGIRGDPRVTGKPAESDLTSRKRSLPVVPALTSGTATAEHLAWLYGRQEDPDEHTITHAARLVEAAGGREWGAAQADLQMRSALTYLQTARPEPDGSQDPQTLPDLITRRDRRPMTTDSDIAQAATDAGLRSASASPSQPYPSKKSRQGSASSNHPR